jgi:Ni/Co efflux regulator RcnB
MRAKVIVNAIAALSVGFSGLSFAQQDKDMRADQANREEHRGVPPPRAQDPGRVPPPQRNGDPARRGDGHDREFDRGRHAAYPRGDRERGPHEAGVRHRFSRGDRLPTEYRSRQYVVDDWRGRHLHAPPRGYHWVEADGSFLLVAITTGVIASILLSQ